MAVLHAGCVYEQSTCASVLATILSVDSTYLFLSNQCKTGLACDLRCQTEIKRDRLIEKSVQELLLVKIKSELWSSFEELGGNLLNLLT